jgi:hypothetical protein
MLRAYSKNITGTANTGIEFDTNKILTNTSVTHTEGSANIVVRTPGYYAVTVSSSFKAATTSTTEDTQATSTDISLQLFANGIAIPDALASDTVSSNVESISFSTIIKATPGTFGSNVTLTVVPTADIDISNIAIGINRIA